MKKMTPYVLATLKSWIILRKNLFINSFHAILTHERVRKRGSREEWHVLPLNTTHKWWRICPSVVSSVRKRVSSVEASCFVIEETRFVSWTYMFRHWGNAFCNWPNVFPEICKSCGFQYQVICKLSNGKSYLKCCALKEHKDERWTRFSGRILWDLNKTRDGNCGIFPCYHHGDCKRRHSMITSVTHMTRADLEGGAPGVRPL